jgi:hypothetical protein
LILIILVSVAPAPVLPHSGWYTIMIVVVNLLFVSRQVQLVGMRSINQVEVLGLVGDRSGELEIRKYETSPSETGLEYLVCGPMLCTAVRGSPFLKINLKYI